MYCQYFVYSVVGHRNFNFQSLIILKMPFLPFNFLFPLSPLCFLPTSRPSFFTPYPFLLLHLLPSSLTRSYPPALSRSFPPSFSPSLFPLSALSSFFLFPCSFFSLFIIFCLSSCFLNSKLFAVLRVTSYKPPYLPGYPSFLQATSTYPVPPATTSPQIVPQTSSTRISRRPLSGPGTKRTSPTENSEADINNITKL